MKVGVLLFSNFETLDVFGPVEILGRLTDLYEIHFYSLGGGIVTNAHGVSMQTEKISLIQSGTDIFLIPGGYGTRIEINNVDLIDAIKIIAEKSVYVFTVWYWHGTAGKNGLAGWKKSHYQ